MIEAIQRGVPEYARPLDDAYRGTVSRAVTHAIGQFVERIANPATPRKKTAEMFREIGRIEAAEGRNLESLQMALRLGARVAWRGFCLKATNGWELDADVLARIGEAIFLYLDELAGACSEGFTSARAEVAGRSGAAPAAPAQPGGGGPAGLPRCDRGTGPGGPVDAAAPGRGRGPAPAGRRLLRAAARAAARRDHGYLPRRPVPAGPGPRRPGPGPDDRAGPARLDRRDRPRGAAGPGQPFAALGPPGPGPGPARDRRPVRRRHPLQRSTGHAGDLRGRGTGQDADREPPGPVPGSAPGPAGHARADPAVLAAERRQRQGRGPPVAHPPADRAVPAAPVAEPVRRDPGRPRQPVRAGNRPARPPPPRRRSHRDHRHRDRRSRSRRGRGRRNRSSRRPGAGRNPRERRHPGQRPPPRPPRNAPAERPNPRPGRVSPHRPTPRATSHLRPVPPPSTP